MFIKRTLSKSLFQNILREVGGAEQYVSYLYQCGDDVEAEDIVSMIGLYVGLHVCLSVRLSVCLPVCGALSSGSPI